MKDHYDCIVIGGGPAGSTTAALVAQAGLSVLLVEREKMPHDHLGQSLMPEPYETLQRLGVLEPLQDSTLVRQVRVQFVSPAGQPSPAWFFPQQAGQQCSPGWQLDRPRVDQMLLDHAAKHVEFHQRSRVRDVVFHDQRAVGVRLQNAAGEIRAVFGRVVVDASVQQALLPDRFRQRLDKSPLRKAAIWGDYRHTQRENAQAEATLILHTRNQKAWFWYLPQADDVTRIGVVADRQYLLEGRGQPAAVFEDELVNCPALVERLMAAELVSKFHVARECSEIPTPQAGQGWMLLGNSLGLLDPVFSSELFLALKAGEMAADAIVEGLRHNDTSAAQLGKWTAGFQAGRQSVCSLVNAFYTDQASFARFLRHYPQHHSGLRISRVFSEGQAIRPGAWLPGSLGGMAPAR